MPQHALTALPTEGSAVAVFDIAACVALMEDMMAIVARAAAAIRQCGASSLRLKADGSPVTAADEAAEAVILQGLERLAPDIPVVSEERSAADQAYAVSSPTYFLVDPLDGTREFIAGRDEFTVNIALIDAGTPLLGIVAAPAADLTWRGIVGGNAERMALTGKGVRTTIRSRRRPAQPVGTAVPRLAAEVPRIAVIQLRDEVTIEHVPLKGRDDVAAALRGWCRMRVIACGQAELLPYQCGVPGLPLNRFHEILPLGHGGGKRRAVIVG